MAEEPVKTRIAIPVMPEELEEILAGPAVYANKTYLTASGPMARLTFAEHMQGKRPRFRAAVALSIDDLLKLRGLLEEMLAQVEVVEATPKKSDG